MRAVVSKMSYMMSKVASLHTVGWDEVTKDTVLSGGVVSGHLLSGQWDLVGRARTP